MLKPLKREEFDRYIDFAYSLALDQHTSAYPTYADGVSTRDEFVRIAKRAFDRDEEEILLFLQNSSVEGWLHYYRLPADKYVQVSVCNVRHYADLAIRELTAYLKEKFPGETLYFGIPGCNSDYAATLEQLGYQKENPFYVDFLLFSDYHPLPEAESITKVTPENFELFRRLHTQTEDEMYWTADRLFAHLDEWCIYLHGEDAAILFMADEVSAEIFGIDYANGAFHPTVFRSLMCKALNVAKATGSASMLFFNGEEEHDIVAELGFQNVGTYVLYILEL